MTGGLQLKGNPSWIFDLSVKIESLVAKWIYQKIIILLIIWRHSIILKFLLFMLKYIRHKRHKILDPQSTWICKSLAKAKIPPHIFCKQKSTQDVIINKVKSLNTKSGKKLKPVESRRLSVGINSLSVCYRSVE
jgi:hypothetical protein